MGPDGLFRDEYVINPPKKAIPQLREPELIPYGTLETLQMEDAIKIVEELQLREPDMTVGLGIEQIQSIIEKSREGILVQEP